MSQNGTDPSMTVKLRRVDPETRAMFENKADKYAAALQLEQGMIDAVEAYLEAAPLSWLKAAEDPAPGNEININGAVMVEWELHRRFKVEAKREAVRHG